MADVIELSGFVQTNFAGIKKLYEFYYDARQHVNTTIHIDFYKLNFLDGNLCALFLSMIYKLQKDNNLKFSTDHGFIKSKFDVLARNGFIKLSEAIEDEKNSTVCLRQFDINKPDEFIEYIQNDLMSHRGLNLTSDDTDKILDCFIEIFSNIEIHSMTNEPFFVCGQYYPEKGILKFTMVDLGNGFLPAIKAKTKEAITSSYESILWALEERNTTKLNAPGGLGLPDLRKYFSNNNGHIQIITGDAFWSSEFDNSTIKYQKFTNECFGTMINLLFSYN